MCNSTLELTDNYKDLGNISASSFEFKLHINAVTCKAFKMLGFVIRLTKAFEKVRAIIRIIYKALILPILLYGYVVWSLYYQDYIKKL